MDSRRSGQCVCVCTCMNLSERMGLDIREVIQAAKLLSTPSIYMSVRAPKHMESAAKPFTEVPFGAGCFKKKS